jgi:NAD(P)-dependent dehydrogenase (short-subunit alcohol dehydrogenase family)
VSGAGRLPELRDRVALVTGAASGIGRATATRLAREGMRLVLADVDEPGLGSLAADLGERVLLARRVDVADRAAMAAFAEQVHALVPAVDLLVNNAGVAFAGGILDTPLPQWDWVLGINLGGVVHGCHYFVPPMVRRGRGGYVVNISSVFGLYAAPGVTAYVASKFAVLGLSRAMRTELAPHGVGVSAVCPGMIATQIVASARAPEGRSMGRAVELFKQRGADPAEVATAVVAAARTGRPIVPVTASAWAILGLSRLAPGLLDRVGARALTRTS